MKVAVLGAGAWGTALAISFSAQHKVHLWCRSPEAARGISTSRVNARYLPGFSLPSAVLVGADLGGAIDKADVIVAAVPVAALREIASKLGASKAALVLACKGLEQTTGALPHEVVRAAIGERLVSVLSGPSFAKEVALGLPAAVVLASTDSAHAHGLARMLHSAKLRMYSSDDLVGVEIAGATKNVMAIAAGICDGLVLGLNARAALISRGLAEIARLGLALGGRTETFMGLAGAGDLILTCTGDLSRNRTVGLRLASGMPLAEILRTLGHVAEGVSTAHEIARLAARHSVDMPLTAAVCAVLSGASTPAAAVAALLERDPKAEF
jgi:glycerol-3-phosphate dehydrogenase (NAD(P)+)